MWSLRRGVSATAVCSITSCPQMAIDQFHERQLYEADLALERQRIQQRMAALEGEECAAVC